MYGVGFEPTSLSTVELESTPLNRSGIHTIYIYIYIYSLFKLFLFKLFFIIIAICVIFKKMVVILMYLS